MAEKMDLMEILTFDDLLKGSDSGLWEGADGTASTSCKGAFFLLESACVLRVGRKAGC